MEKTDILFSLATKEEKGKERRNFPSLLARNRANYNELRKKLNEKECEAIERIKFALLELPMIHKSRHRFKKKERILPASQLRQDQLSMIDDFDRKLGLDQFVYFYWGIPERSVGGGTYVLIDPHILLNENCVITPADINDYRYQESTQKMAIERYFRKMITGKDWLEIIARRILKAVQKGQLTYQLWDFQSLGEIKFFGVVEPRWILGQPYTIKDLSALEVSWYEHGFSCNRHGYGVEEEIPNRVEKIPVNIEKAKAFWQNVVRNKT
ncbi:MAG: hypothetical protein A2804_03415 [Candidatus Pacebacteria bacterium RIFCSPHIGHO2_01_FULL_46_10]|nr:MAG: hypothetical protein A2804_03415 [Candidatus Pacebacteria bacterium RIFCSPHIGHO2_01_FULL_46_10]